MHLPFKRPLGTPPNAQSQHHTLTSQLALVSNAHFCHTAPLKSQSASISSLLLPERPTEKRITERNLLNAPHIRIIYKIRIDIEEDRHINRLSCIQPLFLKAKTLNLAKIRRNLSRRNTICCNPNNILVTFVRSSIESQSCFTR